MKKKNVQKRLNVQPKQNTIRQTMRDAILSEMAKRSWTTYRLAQEVKGKLNQQSVYDFINANSDIKASSIETIMAVLGLTVSHVEPHVEPKTAKT